VNHAEVALGASLANRIVVHIPDVAPFPTTSALLEELRIRQRPQLGDFHLAIARRTYP
jgi:hypothetical protein